MKFLVLVLLSGSVMASSDGEAHGSPSDLISSFVNVIILGAFLIWKLKGVFQKHFTNKSKEISEIMERASVKAKEAQMMMDMQKKKIENLKSEVSKINSDVDSDINKFKSNYSKEVSERIDKLKSDASSKIETEKQELANELNETLVDSVIAKAKEAIKKDSSLNSKAAASILEGLK